MPKIVQLDYRKLVKIFETAGFKTIRKKGDHIILTKSGISRPIVIPMLKEIPVFVIKNNLRSAEISRQRYFELLKKFK
ncbi:MAG: type II toxin-antitoxin system HicA family toxin [Candidatus Portnoybacteria bacterium]|nr:type II toxin-antitoxin system HicA family toxin [Candidatus Portnoybacteria bacterium]